MFANMTYCLNMGTAALQTGNYQHYIIYKAKESCMKIDLSFEAWKDDRPKLRVLTAQVILPHVAHLTW